MLAAGPAAAVANDLVVQRVAFDRHPAGLGDQAAGGFGQALLSGINRGLGKLSLRFPVKIINDLWFENDEVKLSRSRSPAAIADSGSFRFHHCSDINSQKHLTVAPRGNHPGGSPMAAKVAQFLAVTDKLIAPDKRSWPKHCLTLS